MSPRHACGSHACLGAVQLPDHQAHNEAKLCCLYLWRCLEFLLPLEPWLGAPFGSEVCNKNSERIKKNSDGN